MSEQGNAEFLRQAGMERDMLRRFLAGRMTAANVLAVSYGMAALLGEIAAATARPGMLDLHLDSLAASMRANAELKLDRQANTATVGHG